jgi:hypothetical protein
MSHKILETNNYSKFELSPFNREIGKLDNLITSMKKFGFLSGCPITVRRKSNGKLMIILGHHRFYAAQSLGIPIKYVEEKQILDPYIIEKAGRIWEMKDWAISRWNNDQGPYIVVMEYHKATGIPLHCCISMLAGDSAGSGNHSEAFKNGRYKLGDPTHANIVKEIVLHLKKCGIDWAANRSLVQAISKVAWAEGFNHEVLKKKITNHRQFVQKQPSKQAYVDMIDAIYNYGSRQKIDLSFRAEEAAKRRNAINKKKADSPKTIKEQGQQKVKAKPNYNLEVLYS